MARCVNVFFAQSSCLAGMELNGGVADFDDFKVEDPMADRTANLPIGKTIRFSNLPAKADRFPCYLRSIQQHNHTIHAR
jgi:hypothetical protein